MARKVNENILAIAFDAKSGYTPAVDDAVKISDDMEIDLADGSNNYVGLVKSVRSASATDTSVRATVNTRFNRLKDDCVANAAITAGEYIVPVGDGTYDPRTSEDWTLVCALAITGAGKKGDEFSALFL